MGLCVVEVTLWGGSPSWQQLTQELTVGMLDDSVTHTQGKCILWIGGLMLF